jgi:hypothetical protein
MHMVTITWSHAHGHNDMVTNTWSQLYGHMHISTVTAAVVMITFKWNTHMHAYMYVDIPVQLSEEVCLLWMTVYIHVYIHVSVHDHQMIKWCAQYGQIMILTNHEYSLMVFKRMMSSQKVH